MRRIMVRFYQLSLVRFALTGMLNTLVGLGAIFILKWWFGLGDTAANLLGYGLGLGVSYLVNSRWTFSHRQSLLAVLPRYAVTIALAYIANLACVHFCIRQLGMNSYLAQVWGVAPYAGLSYILLRVWVFAAKNESIAPEL